MPVLGRQHHLFDGGYFVAVELARARSWARRAVGEIAGFLCSPPGMVAPRLEADDVEDGSQGKECIGTGDGAKEPSLGLSFRETIFVEGEAGSTKQSEQEANNGGKAPCPFLPPGTGSEYELEVLADRVGCNDGTDAALAPGGNGGARNL